MDEIERLVQAGKPTSAPQPEPKLPDGQRTTALWKRRQ
jgi:hypothetical protein